MEWLEEQLGDFDDDYTLFDCPGDYSNSVLFDFLKTMFGVV